MALYFRHITHLLVATCLVATWSVVVIAQSAEQLRPRAEAGDAEAKFRLGVMYANGRDVPRNRGEAVRWYRLAADQGLAEAQYSLLTESR